ncbi:MAG: glycosyltransferase [Candidatus Woesebacteria bacterium]|nr:MAG: glycosyltransferase [Candidatus Woesebacteria bacterium]
MSIKNEAQKLTIIIPAYKEAGSVGDTVKSLINQTTPPKQIIVIDDCSTDNTAEVAKASGAKVVTPPHNTGTKAGAQNYGLSFVDTKYVMAIDADTIIAKDGVEKLLPALFEKNVVAACGSVIPRYRKTLWERGRYIEYLMAFTFYKPIQNYFEKPLISSGCFSVYKTKILKKMGGWQTRTMAEDMDLTWSFYHKGYSVRFVPEAVSYPIEPHNFNFMKKQLKRWSHGFMQNVILHGKEVIEIPYLAGIITVGLWDALIASLSYLFLAPVLTLVFRNPIFLLAYIIDAPAIAAPVLIKAYERKEFWEALTSIPSFFVLRFVNCYFILEAFFQEIVFKNRLTVYEKGH